MPPTYQMLACPECNSTVLLQLWHLKAKPGAGLIAEPGGWQCAECRAVVDTPKMLQGLHVREKREELRLLEEELGIDHADTRGTV